MKHFIITLVFFLMASSFIFCQNLKPATEAQKKEILSQISQTAAKTTSLQCAFVQKKNISVLSETVTSSGMLYFKKESNLRWQYNKPYSYLFILSGGKVLIKNNNKIEKFDTNSNKLFKEISETMMGGVRGDVLINNKKFNAQFLVGSSTVVVKLLPRNKDLKELMSAIHLTFSKSDWMVQSIEMKEKGGDNTIITFTEKNVNKKISDDLFRIN